MKRSIILICILIFSSNTSAATCGRYFQNSFNQNSSHLENIYTLLSQVKWKDKKDVLYFVNSKTRQTLILYVETNSVGHWKWRTKDPEPQVDMNIEKLIQQLQEQKYHIVGSVRQKNGSSLSSEFHRAKVFSLQIKDKYFFDWDKKNKLADSENKELINDIRQVPLVISSIFQMGSLVFNSYQLTLNTPHFDRAIVLLFELVLYLALAKAYRSTYVEQLNQQKTAHADKSLMSKRKLLRAQWTELQDIFTQPSQNTLVLISEEFLEQFNEKLEQAGFELAAPDVQSAQP